MSKKRASFSNEFKVKVVIESLRENQTIAEIAAKHKVDPKNIINWRNRFLENAQLIFEQNEINEKLKQERKEHQEQVGELHQQIGEITVVNDWLKKKSRELGLGWQIPFHRD